MYILRVLESDNEEEGDYDESSDAYSAESYEDDDEDDEDEYSSGERVTSEEG